MSESIEDIIRRVVREELAAALGRAPSTQAEPAQPAPAPKRVSPNGWEEVDSLRVQGMTGAREYEVRVGSRVQVIGTGKRSQKNPSGAPTPDWVIEKLERRAHGGIYDFNVTVTKALTTHVVKANRVLYQRPKGA